MFDSLYPHCNIPLCALALSFTIWKRDSMCVCLLTVEKVDSNDAVWCGGGGVSLSASMLFQGSVLYWMEMLLVINECVVFPVFVGTGLGLINNIQCVTNVFCVPVVKPSLGPSQPQEYSKYRHTTNVLLPHLSRSYETVRLCVIHSSAPTVWLWLL